MAKLANVANIPVPSTERGQRSIPISEAYFARIIPSWSQPSTLFPDQWRAWVRSQPIATTCKETMVSNISDLDWKITPRESDKRDELKGTIEHYEELLRKGGGSLSWVEFLELTIEDLLDLPFGSAWEVGRKGDSPEGRVMWLEPIDGGTCYPTNNKDYPVYQYYNGFEATFPQYAVARTYMNPRPEIERKGWGVAPPERIFMAMEMLMRGDRYYANLLLDIPPAGVFDLGDITWEDANVWIQSFRSAVTGVGSADSFKIPVLAEHTGKVSFIPLGKAPNDIMYDRITLKYASLVCAGYGMNLGDIGVQSASSSGETLAGSIRGEQKTNRTGKARVKAKIKYLIESFLPSTLRFDFIDTDGERLSMIGRARLANATAFNQLRQMGAISPEEARLQAIQDGLLTISMPEKPPKEAKPPVPVSPFGGGKKPPERPAAVGSPQPPSLGGDGEVKKSFTYLPSSLQSAVESITSAFAPAVTDTLRDVAEDDYEVVKSALINTVFSQTDELGVGSAIGLLMKDIKVGDFFFDENYPHPEVLKKRCERDFPIFIGKAIIYTYMQSPDNVYETVRENLSEYVSAFVDAETESVLRDIEEELPEEVKVRVMARATPNVVTVEAPQVTLPSINVTVPERSVQVGTPNVNVYPDVTVNVPEQSAPQISVNVPKQETPIVNLSVPETQVNVSSPVNVTVPAQPTPNVNIRNEVNPTPVTVENSVAVQPAQVVIPKPVREYQTVTRKDGLIESTDTSIEYEE